MKIRSFKVLTSLFLAGLFIICGAGISSAKAYTVKQLETIAQKSPNEINKELKDKEITIKNFEIKDVDLSSGSATLSSVNMDFETSVKALAAALPAGYAISTSTDGKSTDGKSIPSGSKEVVIISIITSDKELIGSKVGDKITVNAKLQTIEQHNKMYSLVFVPVNDEPKK
jgi:hypothetical protein